jgi:hypothetical protein
MSDDVHSDLVQGRFRRKYLRQDVVAVLPGLDHRLQAADLPLEAPEPIEYLLPFRLVVECVHWLLTLSGFHGHS